MSQEQTNQTDIPVFNPHAPLKIESVEAGSEEENKELKKIKRQNNIVFLAGSLASLLIVIGSLLLGYLYFR